MHLRDANPDHPGYKHVITLRDTFEHCGPSGRHVCLVMELTAETVDSFSCFFPKNQIPSKIMRRLTRKYCFLHWTMRMSRG